MYIYIYIYNMKYTHVYIGSENNLIKLEVYKTYFS